MSCALVNLSVSHPSPGRPLGGDEGLSRAIWPAILGSPGASGTELGYTPTPIGALGALRALSGSLEASVSVEPEGRYTWTTSGTR